MISYHQTPAEEVLGLRPSTSRLSESQLTPLIYGDHPLKETMKTLEEILIKSRLERFGQNRTRCAESLGLSRQSLQAKLAKWRDRSET